MIGVAHVQKARLWPTQRSQSSDWLSCVAMPKGSLTGRSMWRDARPCSYSACPHSWMVPITPSIQFSSEYRVVIRTSVGCDPPVKGCTDTSILPFSKSNPSASATSRHISACLAGSHSGPPLSAAGTSLSLGSAATWSAICVIMGASPLFTSSKTAAMRGAFILGSKLSMAPSYRSMSGLVTFKISLRRSIMASRCGEYASKSACERARTHAE
mmetsp:Transcript_48652/g.97369  ORF Transcript_48652/g.97369 Transcript_48652/m.97369 type:complete len:213 (-) Transcript_48652:329-967(-)